MFATNSAHASIITFAYYDDNERNSSYSLVNSIGTIENVGRHNTDKIIYPVFKEIDNNNDNASEILNEKFHYYIIMDGCYTQDVDTNVKDFTHILDAETFLNVTDDKICQWLQLDGLYNIVDDYLFQQFLRRIPLYKLNFGIVTMIFANFTLIQNTKAEGHELIYNIFEDYRRILNHDLFFQILAEYYMIFDLFDGKQITIMTLDIRNRQIFSYKYNNTWLKVRQAHYVLDFIQSYEQIVTKPFQIIMQVTILIPFNSNNTNTFLNESNSRIDDLQPTLFIAIRPKSKYAIIYATHKRCLNATPYDERDLIMNYIQRSN